MTACPGDAEEQTRGEVGMGVISSSPSATGLVTWAGQPMWQVQAT